MKIKSNKILFKLMLFIIFHRGEQMLENLKKISEFVIGMFYQLFFSSNDGTNSNSSLVKENNQLQPSTIQILQTKLLRQLGDWFSFIETKSQGNITIS